MVENSNLYVMTIVRISFLPLFIFFLMGDCIRLAGYSAFYTPNENRKQSYQTKNISSPIKTATPQKNQT